ncbi:MAG: hypothetical protein NW241_08705 [Bacteroidia bacterium]|nr:hypothetical protein [Bacteroidia bacterium]
MPQLRITLTLALLLLGLWLPAQDSLLYRLNDQRIRANRTHMYVLGGWALGNIAAGSVLRARSTGSARYFHEMNAVWNVVNLGLAAGGLYGSYTSDPAAYGAWDTYQEQQKLEKILLFNLALNFTYMTAGAWMQERAKTASRNPERLKGYGQSLVLQGGFLLLFDTAQYLRHHSLAAPGLEQLFQHLQAGPGTLGFSVWF